MLESIAKSLSVVVYKTSRDATTTTPREYKQPTLSKRSQQFYLNMQEGFNKYLNVLQALKGIPPIYNKLTICISKILRRREIKKLTAYHKALRLSLTMSHMRRETLSNLGERIDQNDTHLQWQFQVTHREVSIPFFQYFVHNTATGINNRQRVTIGFGMFRIFSDAQFKKLILLLA